MGLIQHQAIVVTGHSVEGAHALALKVFGDLVSPLIPSANFVSTFLIAPDGSKEGWSTSDQYDAKRRRFKDKLEKLPGFSGHWVEVSYGENEQDAVIDGSLIRAESSARTRTSR